MSLELINEKTEQYNMFKGSFRFFSNLMINSFVWTLLIIVSIQVFLPDYLGKVLLGSNTKSFPITFQTVMWFPFSVSMLWLYSRFKYLVRNQTEFLSFKDRLESRGPGAMIIDEFYEVYRFHGDRRSNYLSFILGGYFAKLGLTSRSNDLQQAVQARGDSLFADLDSVYSQIRYLTWLLPTMGFMGTVLGISSAVSGFKSVTGGDAAKGLEMITGQLAIAFDTTLLSLIQSAVVMFVLTMIEEREVKLIEEIRFNVGEYIGQASAGESKLQSFDKSISEAKVA